MPGGAGGSGHGGSGHGGVPRETVALRERRDNLSLIRSARALGYDVDAVLGLSPGSAARFESEAAKSARAVSPGGDTEALARIVRKTKAEQSGQAETRKSASARPASVRALADQANILFARGGYASPGLFLSEGGAPKRRTLGGE
jgi:hypothetical protein